MLNSIRFIELHRGIVFYAIWWSLFESDEIRCKLHWTESSPVFFCAFFISKKMKKEVESFNARVLSGVCGESNYG